MVTLFALFFKGSLSFKNFNRKCEVWLMNLLYHSEKAYCSKILSPQKRQPTPFITICYQTECPGTGTMFKTYRKRFILMTQYL